MMDSTVELYSEINTFFLKLLLVTVFRHGDRSITRIVPESCQWMVSQKWMVTGPSLPHRVSSGPSNRDERLELKPQK